MLAMLSSNVGETGQAAGDVIVVVGVVEDANGEDDAVEAAAAHGASMDDDDAVGEAGAANADCLSAGTASRTVGSVVALFDDPNTAYFISFLA